MILEQQRLQSDNYTTVFLFLLIGFINFSLRRCVVCTSSVRLLELMLLLSRIVDFSMTASPHVVMFHIQGPAK